MIEIKHRATIETKGFKIDFSNNPDLEARKRINDGVQLKGKSDADIDKNKEDLGKYPVVYLNGIMIESTQVGFLKLNNDSFSPSLVMEFTDSSGKLVDENFPLDNSIISIFKESTNKDLMGIKMDFKLTDFNIVKGTSKDTLTYLVEGVLDIDGLYYNDFESFKGTSYNVLETISNDLKLGFATNIINTNDSMVYVNPSNYRMEFMKDIIERSYITDDTFLFGYIDFYYNFNYVDIEAQLKDDISTQMNMLDRETTIKDGKDDNVALILTNIKDAENTNMYISKYTLMDSSTNINLQYGYKHTAFYYNKIDDEIKRYDLDNITDSDDNAIVLKGHIDDKNGMFENMSCNTYMGKMDTDNVHKNYLHTILQNRNNLKFLQKLKINVRMGKPNYGLYRFQKVLVELYNNGKLNNGKEEQLTDKEIKAGGKEYDSKIMHKLSGEWLITAINFTFSRKDGNIQELTLVK